MGTRPNLAMRLFDIYTRQGFQITSELSAEFVHSDRYTFTRLYKGIRNLTYHLGIALREVHFLESLCSMRYSQNIYIVGNSFAFSTIALALINPNSKVVVIEIGNEDFTAEWIELTNSIAAQEGLNIKVIRGRSPDDNAEIIRRELDGRIDLAFVDGLHTDEAIEADFTSLIPFGHDQTVYIFHDVLTFGLTEGLMRVVEKHPMNGNLFFATPSGIAVLQRDLPPDYGTFCNVYGSNEIVQAIISANLNEKMRAAAQPDPDKPA